MLTEQRQAEPCRSGNAHGQHAVTLLAPGGDRPRPGPAEAAGAGAEVLCVYNRVTTMI